MPRSSLRQLIEQERRTRRPDEARAILIENLRIAEECAILARKNPARASAFLAIARGAHEATLSF